MKLKFLMSTLLICTIKTPMTIAMHITASKPSEQIKEIVLKNDTSCPIIITATFDEPLHTLQTMVQAHTQQKHQFHSTWFISISAAALRAKTKRNSTEIDIDITTYTKIVSEYAQSYPFFTTIFKENEAEPPSIEMTLLKEN